MKKRMKVLWIALEGALQEDADFPSLTGRHERVMTRFCGDRVQLSVACMADGKHEAVVTRDGVTYYQVDADMRIDITAEGREKLNSELLRVISESEPDIIQCFGCEWPYGAIAEAADVPVVIHMMGFLNIYFPSIRMARGYDDPAGHPAPAARGRLRRIAARLLRRSRPEVSPEISSEVSPEDVVSEAERRIMAANRYFLGRTEWDRNIVKYYSPGSKYYHVEEAVKGRIYDAAGQWRYRDKGKIRIFSLSSADDRKGNEIILRAAAVLRDVAGVDFEWKVAGHKDFFSRYEDRAGIRREDVNIELLGMIGSGQIIEELKAADFFVHPSIVDNSPHSVCEAQLIGCPVIASNVGGVPDLVENGVTGFLYPYNEPHTLAFQICNLRGKEELLTRISSNETKEALRRHDPETIARTLADTYEDIIRDYKKTADLVRKDYGND